MRYCPWQVGIFIAVGAGVSAGWLTSTTGAVEQTAPLVASTPAGSNAALVRDASAGPLAAEAPIKRFEPLAALPFTTQVAVRGVVWGAEWLHRRHQTQGRFLYGFNPALREPLVGEDDIAQARAALALALAARFCGEEKYAATAGQTILTLLTAAPPDPRESQVRVPRAPSAVCNRVGFASALMLAIHALPGADNQLLEDGERLWRFLRRQLREDGSVHYIDDAAGQPLRQDPQGLYEHPGWALWAIATSHRRHPSEEKQGAVRRGLRLYRTHSNADPHPMLAATLILAAAEWTAQTRDSEAAATAYEAAERLCRAQIPVTDPRLPQWAGAFRQYRDGRLIDVPSGPETGIYVLALAAACETAKQLGDLPRFNKYAAAVVDASRYLAGLQYTEANTRHFEAAFRTHMLIGAFHLGPNDGNIRLDATAHALLGWLRFLHSGAER